MRFLYTLITYAAYPLLLGFGMLNLWLLTPSLGDAAALVSIIATVALMAVFEAIHPYTRSWRRPWRESKHDWALNLFGAIVPTELVNATILVVLGTLAGHVSAAVGGTLWPGTWPFVAQFMLALLVAEFVVYWGHRALHEVEYLWRFHSVHHSADRLYWLNANRVHPVESLVVYLPTIAVFTVLGCPLEVLKAWSVFAGVHGILQHLNVRVALGKLNYLLSTPDLHRRHHSRKRELADCNYGAVLIIWDIIFRTRHELAPDHDLNDLGVEGDLPFRPAVTSMLLSPFVPGSNHKPESR